MARYRACAIRERRRLIRLKFIVALLISSAVQGAQVAHPALFTTLRWGECGDFRSFSGVKLDWSIIGAGLAKRQAWNNL
jgi:hypothetical protein